MAAWKAGRIDRRRGHEATHQRKGLTTLPGVGYREHTCRPIVVEGLDEVAAEHNGVVNLAGPVPADLAVTDADLELVIQAGRHSDRAERCHRRLEQHSQSLPPGRRHARAARQIWKKSWPLSR